jgi:TRAP-type C4-dicarboxylate transport system permease small subunit
MFRIMFRIMTGLSNAIVEVTAFFARLLVLFVGASMLMQVILRYIFRAALPWPEEASRYAMIWLVCLCGNILVRNEELITVDFLDRLWPPKLVKYRNFFYRLLLLVVLLVLLREGINQAISGGKTISSALGIEFFWPYLSVPVGAALMLYQMVYIIIRDFIVSKKERSDHEKITTQYG